MFLYMKKKKCSYYNFDIKYFIDVNKFSIIRFW